ncbi:UPF0280 family protein [[Eubacterium] cellulosolvens]
MSCKSDHSNQVSFLNKLYRKKLSIEETQGLIISDKTHAIQESIECIKKTRIELKEYLQRHPPFYYSLNPVEIPKNSPSIIKKMAHAAFKADVGPMAAVAGALIDIAFEQMKKTGAKTAVIENGGEVIAESTQPVYAGIYAGPSPLSGKLAIKLTQFPIGVATSSASVSEALTFGLADAATILAENAALADAAATVACNMVQGDDCRKSVKKGLSVAGKIEGVIGAIIIRGNYIGSIGDIPELVSVSGNIKDVINAQREVNLF